MLEFLNVKCLDIPRPVRHASRRVESSSMPIIILPLLEWVLLAVGRGLGPTLYLGHDCRARRFPSGAARARPRVFLSHADVALGAQLGGEPLVRDAARTGEA